MSKPKVYLYGRISELSYDQAVGWRDEATKALCQWFEFPSPMRHKEQLRGLQRLTGA
jgi:hypothetical protein